MSDTPTKDTTGREQDNPDVEDQDETTEETPDGGPGQAGAGGADQDESDESEDEASKEAARWKRKHQRADAAARKAQAELAELRKKAEGGDEPDPVAQANAKLIRASARSVLAGAGVTDKDAQATVLQYLNLDGVDVDANGDPDEDEIQDRVDALREAFGAAQAAPARRTPRVVTKDRGGSQRQPADPDAARYARILGRRG